MMSTEVQTTFATQCTIKETKENDAPTGRGRTLSNGYADNRFEGKMEQMKQVCQKLKGNGFIPQDLIENEVTWFYK